MLGGEIASIEENFYGVMEKTRVYAGGAVIGEQKRWTATGQSTGEAYSYIFRDPVSGSVDKGGLQEHFEPLGQKIDPMPPLEEPTQNRCHVCDSAKLAQYFFSIRIFQLRCYPRTSVRGLT